jgi:hypothetical protein
VLPDIDKVYPCAVGARVAVDREADGPAFLCHCPAYPAEPDDTDAEVRQ